MTRMRQVVTIVGARPQFIKAAACVFLLTAVLPGCISRYEVSVKNAWMMYTEQHDNLGPPSEHRRTYVESEIGRERFVQDLSKFVATKYGPEALYGIGWFGDESDLSVVAGQLDSPDPERARVALASFNRLSKRQFLTAKDARLWWRANK